MFDIGEADWKPWRTIYAKGFHSDRINSLVPGMVQEALTYAKTLRDVAKKGEMTFLEPITLRFTIDMIGKTILNSSLGAQTGYNALADGMLSQIRWWHNANNSVNPLSKLNFVRDFMQWKNGRQMNQYIGDELDKRYEEYKTNPNSAKSVSIIDLTLRAYLSGPYKSSNPPARLDPDFRAFTIRQIRLFVFAGHDSTASSICYAFYCLSKHPEALARLREEHDKVLGKNPTEAASKIAAEPHLLNALPYTLAVLKESMRLFPPAGASREGSAGVNLTNDAGQACPTEGTILWILHPEIHSWEKYWVRGNEFLPERWLVPEGHELYPRPGTWRPFEVGPRNCIAQAMVMVELKVVLACLARELDITPAYEEWDRKNGVKSESKLVHGERAYLIEKGASHPVGGFPCRVSLAQRN